MWSASSNYLNQFWVIAHYTHRNKSSWKWKLNQDISSSSPSAAYMRQRIGWALFHIMACRLFGAKPLPKPMLTYCQLIGPLGINFSEIRTKIRSFSLKKMHLKRSPAKWRPFCPGGDELTLHSICDFHSLTNVCCGKMAVALHMIFSKAFLEKKWGWYFYVNFTEIRSS